MTANASPRRADGLPMPPLAVMSLAGVVQHLIAGRRGVTMGSGLAAALVGTGSAWLLGGAVARFLGQGTTVNPVTVGASSLVVSGPNRLSRNPMYLGMAGLLVSHALARRSPQALLPALAFIVVIDRNQIPGEEDALRALFGADFERYAAVTPRWLGKGSLARFSQ